MYQMMRLRGTEYLKKALTVNNNHSITKKWQENNPNATESGENVFTIMEIWMRDFLEEESVVPHSAR